MTLSKQVFVKCFTMLCERFNRSFSAETVSEYYRAFERLSDEQFRAACQKVFLDDEFFPSPRRVIDLGEATLPVTPYSLPAGTPPAYWELPEGEQQVFKSRVAELVAIASSNRKGFTSVGELLQQQRVEPAPDEKRLQDLALFESWKRNYLAYRDVASMRHLADREMDRIRDLVGTAHPAVVGLIKAFIESEEGAVIDEAIASLIEAGLEQEGL